MVWCAARNPVNLSPRALGQFQACKRVQQKLVYFKTSQMLIVFRFTNFFSVVFCCCYNLFNHVVFRTSEPLQSNVGRVFKNYMSVEICGQSRQAKPGKSRVMTVNERLYCTFVGRKVASQSLKHDLPLTLQMSSLRQQHKFSSEQKAHLSQWS